MNFEELFIWAKENFGPHAMVLEDDDGEVIIYTAHKSIGDKSTPLVAMTEEELRQQGRETL